MKSILCAAVLFLAVSLPTYAGQSKNTGPCKGALHTAVEQPTHAITLKPEHLSDIDKVVEDLKNKGVRVIDVLEEIGIINAAIEPDQLEDVRNMPEVFDVSPIVDAGI